MGLRHVDPSGPGWGRRRSGRGFVYLDEHGEPIRDANTKQRCRDLVIPPAWQHVWICPDARGHIQATGIDDAGRRQYLYHPVWRAAQDALKHDRVLDVAGRLPAARRRVRADLAQRGMPRTKALAIAFLLLDQGLFRLGSETYADEHGSFGLATIRKEHLRITREGTAVFDYPGKSGVRAHVQIDDPDLLPALRTLRNRRGGGAELLAYRRPGAPVRWVNLTSSDINEYIKYHLGEQASAKDFRTWHSTVLAAVALALGPREETERAQQKRIRQAVSLVAEHLGNTPAVSRSSYIDPRVIETYQNQGAIDVVPPDAAASIAEHTDARDEDNDAEGTDAEDTADASADAEKTDAPHDDAGRLNLPVPADVERQVLQVLKAEE